MIVIFISCEELSRFYKRPQSNAILTWKSHDVHVWMSARRTSIELESSRPARSKRTCRLTAVIFSSARSVSMSAKVLVIVFAEILIASCNADVAPVSSDDAIRAGVLNFQLTMNTSSQSKCSLLRINDDFHHFRYLSFSSTLRWARLLSLDCSSRSYGFCHRWF